MTRAKGRRVMTSPDFDTDTGDVADDSNADNSNSGTENVGFYNIFDGTKGRTDSIYLDIQERRAAEVVRARLEGREPNLDDEGALPGSVGTPLVTEAERVDNRYANPSVDLTGHKDVDPVADYDVDRGAGDRRVDLSAAAQVARERQSEDEALLEAASQGDEGNESVTQPADEDAPVENDGSFSTNTTY